MLQGLPVVSAICQKAIEGCTSEQEATITCHQEACRSGRLCKRCLCPAACLFHRHQAQAGGNEGACHMLCTL